MAVIEQLVDTKELKLNKIKSWLNGVEGHFTRYDRELDTLYIHFSDPEKETIVHHLDQHLALLYLPDSLEVVGVQVEDIKLFAKKNNAIKKAWQIQTKCETLVNMEGLYALHDKQEKKVIREVARVTQESLYGSKT